MQYQPKILCVNGFPRSTSTCKRNSTPPVPKSVLKLRIKFRSEPESPFGRRPALADYRLLITDYSKILIALEPSPQLTPPPDASPISPTAGTTQAPSPDPP